MKKYPCADNFPPCSHYLFNFVSDEWRWVKVHLSHLVYFHSFQPTQSMQNEVAAQISTGSRVAVMLKPPLCRITSESDIKTHSYNRRWEFSICLVKWQLYWSSNSQLTLLFQRQWSQGLIETILTPLSPFRMKVYMRTIIKFLMYYEKELESVAAFPTK